MKNKGFTLVELLAVIVILAIIMIIAIPAVLQTLTTAKKRNFENYATRINNETLRKYAEDSLINNNSVARIYDIRHDLGLDSTGNFKGYSAVVPNSNKVYITLYDDEYGLVVITIDDNLQSKIKDINSIDPDYLTAEYLCSQIPEFTSCVYTKYNDDGTTEEETLSPEGHKFDANLSTGQSINTALKTLLSAENIHNILYSSSITSSENKINIASSDSKYPVYIWAEGNTIYYSSESNYIYLNSNSNEMFKGLSNLYELDTSHLKTDDVSTAVSMFEDDTNLTKLDVSNFNFNNVTDLTSMFKNCSSLSELNISNWNVKNISKMKATFLGCTNLTGTLDFSKWSFNNLQNLEQAFSQCENLLVIKFPKATTNKLTLIGSCFLANKKLTYIENIEYLNVSRVTYMDSVFQNCYELNPIDFSKWNAPNIQTIHNAFYNTYKFTTIDLTNFNFSKINTINATFYGTGASKIIFGPKDFSKLTAMTSTFSKCANLTEVDLSNTNFPLLKNMVNTFEESRNLKIINLSGSTFPALTNIQRTFRHCDQIEELDLSGFNTTKVTSMVSTFGFDENLKTIYVSNNWSIESLANEDSKKYTFHNCNSLNNFSASKETADYATLDSGYLTLK